MGKHEKEDTGIMKRGTLENTTHTPTTPPSMHRHTHATSSHMCVHAYIHSHTHAHDNTYADSHILLVVTATHRCLQGHSQTCSQEQDQGGDRSQGCCLLGMQFLFEGTAMSPSQRREGCRRRWVRARQGKSVQQSSLRRKQGQLRAGVGVSHHCEVQ